MISKLASSCIIAMGVFSFFAQAQEVAGDKRDTIPIAKTPDVTPAPAETILQALKKGAKYLLDTQRPDGSWGDHRVIGNENLYCPYPNGPKSFRAASTALCVIGLASLPYPRDEATSQALAKAEEFLLNEVPNVKRADRLCNYNIWVNIYAIDAYCLLAKECEPNSSRYNRLKQATAEQVKILEGLCDSRGGWGYITNIGLTQRPIGSTTSFTTASVLISLKQAKDLFGLTISQKYFNRSIQTLKEQRTPAGTYVYSSDHVKCPTRYINRHTGSLARSPVCDYALMIWDPKSISTTQLDDALDRIWSREGWLTMSLKKPIPHESFASNSGYFYYFGYYYAVMSLELLPQPRVKRHAAYIANNMLRQQETDGSWWDYPVYNYHKFYGTGYTLYILSEAYKRLYAE